jgi:hypothetical protein
MPVKHKNGSRHFKLYHAEALEHQQIFGSILSSTKKNPLPPLDSIKENLYCRNAVMCSLVIGAKPVMFEDTHTRKKSSLSNIKHREEYVQRLQERLAELNDPADSEKLAKLKSILTKTRWRISVQKKRSAFPTERKYHPRFVEMHEKTLEKYSKSEPMKKHSQSPLKDDAQIEQPDSPSIPDIKSFEDGKN